MLYSLSMEHNRTTIRDAAAGTLAAQGSMHISELVQQVMRRLLGGPLFMDDPLAFVGSVQDTLNDMLHDGSLEMSDDLKTVSIAQGDRTCGTRDL